MLLCLNVIVTGIVPTWNNFFFFLFFSKQFTSTIQRSNQDWLRLPHQYCMNNSPDVFVLVVLSDTLIYLKGICIQYMKWQLYLWYEKYELICGKFSAVLQKACHRNGADGVGVSDVKRAELHWPLTKIMWCHFNLTSGLFSFDTAPFSSGVARLAPEGERRAVALGVVWDASGPKPCYTRHCSV